MASGAYRGWTNAETLGVNHWTGGTLQERAQAWANYYGLYHEHFHSLSISNHNNEAGAYKIGYEYGGRRYFNRFKSEMNEYGIYR